MTLTFGTVQAPNWIQNLSNRISKVSSLLPCRDEIDERSLLTKVPLLRDVFLFKIDDLFLVAIYCQRLRLTDYILQVFP